MATIPHVVYKCFAEELYAVSFLQGRVWITTLSYCRGCEDSARADPGEAVHVYNTGTITGDSDNEAFVERARRAGIMIGPGCKSITLSQNRGIQRLADAYVLCTTEDAEATQFGPYCVEIREPKALRAPLTQAICEKTPIVQGVLGKVLYRSRHTAEDEPDPGPVGFVKPADPFQLDREVRFLWTVPRTAGVLTPMLVQCDAVVRHSRRLR